MPSWSSIRWSVSRVVGRPCAAIHFDRHVGSHRERSKVESAVALLQLGWSRAGGGMPLVPGGPLAFGKENLFKSSEYWQALMQLDSIFKKGVAEVFHHRPRAYYRCLMDLDANALNALLQRPDLMELKEAHFMRAFRGLQLPDPGLPALGAEGMAALEDNNDVQMMIYLLQPCIMRLWQKPTPILRASSSGMTTGHTAAGRDELTSCAVIPTTATPTGTLAPSTDSATSSPISKPTSRGW